MTQYLCIVWVLGDPQKMEGNFASEIRYFNTFEEAERFERENWDYGLRIDIFKGECIY